MQPAEKNDSLEDLRPNAAVKGILSGLPVTAVSVNWFGSDVFSSNFLILERHQVIE
jgi:hypothetical protein